jgi:hypothetical protein
MMNRTKDVQPSNCDVVWCFAKENGGVPLKCLWLDAGGFYEATNPELLSTPSKQEVEYWMEIPDTSNEVTNERNMFSSFSWIGSDKKRYKAYRDEQMAALKSGGWDVVTWLYAPQRCWFIEGAGSVTDTVILFDDAERFKGELRRLFFEHGVSFEYLDVYDGQEVYKGEEVFVLLNGRRYAAENWGEIIKGILDGGSFGIPQKSV